MSGKWLIHWSLLLLLTVVWLPAAWATPADQTFMTAKQLMETGHETQATPELKKFLETYPTDARVREAAFMLGRCYQLQKQYEQALAAYTVTIEKSPGTEFAKLRAETYFHQAECSYQLKAFDNAARAYSSCLKTGAADADLAPRAQYWLADSLYQQGRVADALPEYRKVAEMAPTHQLAPWGLYAVGMLELNQTHYAPAIAALERVANQYPEAIDAGEIKRALGLAYAGRAAQGKDPADVTKADDLLSAVVANEKADAATRQEASVALAQMYADLARYPQAAAAYARALALLPPTSAEAWNAHLQRGHALYNNGQFSEAITEYARVANGNTTPEMARTARYWLGNCWFQQGQQSKDAAAMTEAVNALKRFLADAGDSPQAPRATLLMALADEELAAHNVPAARAGAVAAFKELLAKWPASREASQAYAGISRLTASMSPAELEKVAGTLPDGAAAWNVSLQLAREQFLAGKYPDAIAAAKTVLTGKPTDDVLTRASYLIAASYQRLNRPADAIPLYTQTLAHAPAADLQLFAQRGLTRAYLDTHRFSEARDSARALLALPISETEAGAKQTELADRLMMLAETGVGGRQYAEALEAYQRIAKECPATPQAPYAVMGVAWVAEARKDQPAAIAAYRAMLAGYPAHKLAADATFRLGMALVDRKELEQAIAVLKTVPANYPQADEALYAVAWADRDLGRIDDANAQFTRLAEQFPKSPLAGDSLFRLGEYHSEQKAYAEAARDYARAADALSAESKLAPLALFKLGVSAFEAKDFPSAAEAFGKLLARYPAGEFAAESLFWRAQALEGQGTAQAAAARDAYLQYQAKYPAGPFVADAACGAGRTGVAGKLYPAARSDLQKALTLCTQLTAGKNAALAERAKNVQPEAQYWLAQCDLEEKKYSDAIAAFAGVSAFPLEPWYSRSILQMARCSALANDKPAAERTLRLLQEKFPTSDAAHQASQLAQEYQLDIK